MVVRPRVGRARLAEELAAAVAVADRGGAERVGLVYGRAEVREAVRVGFDEQDLAARADGGDHLDVEVDLLAPAGVARGRSRPAALVDLAEAAVRGRAGRETELAAVGREVGRRARVVVGVDDRDRLAVPAPGRAGRIGPLVGGGEVLRRVAGGPARRRERRGGALLSDDVGVAVGEADGEGRAHGLLAVRGQRIRELVRPRAARGGRRPGGGDREDGDHSGQSRQQAAVHRFPSLGVLKSSERNSKNGC